MERGNILALHQEIVISSHIYNSTALGSPLGAFFFRIIWRFQRIIVILQGIMKQLLLRYGNWGLTALLGIAVFLFWTVGYPHALSYHEQYQLFLWTWDYFVERVSVPGGLADWLGEFIVQFYFVEWLGALLLALLFATLLLITAHLLPKGVWRLLSLVPVAVLWWLMGDVNVLLSLPVAVTLALALACVQLPKRLCWLDVVIVPLAYWLIGPATYIYILIRVLQWGWHHFWSAGWLVAVQLMAYAWVLPQQSLSQTIASAHYYRSPSWTPRWAGFEKDMYELIRMDYLVRYERWDDIISRAQTYQVKTPFWSNCVNLALSQKRQLAERQFDFWQSGEDALVMPRVRDLTSMLPSAEVFWRLGMINSAQRYMFDTQESILDGRKSGRCTKRLAECMIVNGHYQVAEKQLSLLKKTLFYRSWAEETSALLYHDEKVNAHPVYGRLRQLRYKDNFLYNYDELDKMFGLLFMNNSDNKMALDYFMAQLLLKGNVQGFIQYLGLVQQQGGYSRMPAGYEDAVRTIQTRGEAPGTMYGPYVKRMMMQKGGRE